VGQPWSAGLGYCRGEGVAASAQPRRTRFHRRFEMTTPFEVFAGEQASMRYPQPGIFALGTASHAYLEFDTLDSRSPAELVQTIASMREPRTTMGGVNLVVGFRPELWREIAPDDAPSGRRRVQRRPCGR
jgi:hypothetical protein